MPGDEDVKPENRTEPVMVRLTPTEVAEIREQANELSLVERRSVSLAEVVRRRAWGQLPNQVAA